MAPPPSGTLPLASSNTPTPTLTNANANSGPSSSARPNLNSLTHEPEFEPNQISSAHELIGWVDSVLAKLETKFSRLEVDVLDRLDVLGKRIDSLETSMAELMDSAGAVSTSGPPTAPLTAASEQPPPPPPAAS